MCPLKVDPLTGSISGHKDLDGFVLFEREFGLGSLLSANPPVDDHDCL